MSPLKSKLKGPALPPPVTTSRKCTSPGKFRSPPYPRPVDRVESDPMPVFADTVVYTSPPHEWAEADETDKEAQLRAAKRRRRIRDAAESYLRGEGLFIMSAALRGPFHEWTNPWARSRARKTMPEKDDLEARKMKTLQTEREVEGVSETEKIRGPETMRREGEVPDTRDLPRTDDDSEVEVEVRLGHVQQSSPNVFGARQPEPPAVPTIQADAPPKDLDPLKTNRIQEWLRKNDDYSRQKGPSGTLPPSSPTPAQKVHAGVSRSLDLQQQPSSAEGDPSQGELNLGSQEAVGEDSPSHDSPARAEVAILENKLRSVHRVPAGTNLEAFEYRRPKRQGLRGQNRKSETVAVKQAEAASADGKSEGPALSEKRGIQNAPFRVATKNDKLGEKPSLPTETSKASASNPLPSAQIVPRLDHAMSNIQSTGGVLEIVSEAAVGQENDAVRNNDETPQVADLGKEKEERDDAQGKSPGDIILPLDCPTTANEPNAAHTPSQEPETQDLIANIKPIGLDLSTIKKPTNASANVKKTPATSSKLPRSRAPARGKDLSAFAGGNPLSDDSQKSIKDSMKINKAGKDKEPATQNGSQPKVMVFAEPEVLGEHPKSLQSIQNDGGNNLGKNHDTLPSVSSMFGTKNKAPRKSILKSSAVPASTTATSTAGPNGTYDTTTDASSKQDAQRPLWPAISDNENTPNKAAIDDALQESFDLDAAIDDLGDFLGTWDPDVEAAKMV